MAWGTNTSRLGVPPPTSNSCSGLALSSKHQHSRSIWFHASGSRSRFTFGKTQEKNTIGSQLVLFRSSPASTPSNISSSSTGHDLRSPKGPQDHGRIPAAESQHFFLLIHLMLVPQTHTVSNQIFESRQLKHY